MLLKGVWLGEEEGMSSWPHLSIMDISSYLKQVFSHDDNIVTRITSEYKQGKAYRYYTAEFINSIKINSITKDSPVCFFKTKCLPGQRIRNKEYEVWALVEKESVESPGGKIVSAHCTCAAGLLGACNHVAGMLFRIEAAVLKDFSNLTCTSQLSNWNIPKQKKKRKPGKLSNCLIKQDKYTKKATTE